VRPDVPYFIILLCLTGQIILLVRRRVLPCTQWVKKKLKGEEKDKGPRKILGDPGINKTNYLNLQFKHYFATSKSK
jgi:hypothetical protein